jgi:hypothetical protein
MYVHEFDTNMGTSAGVQEPSLRACRSVCECLILWAPLELIRMLYFTETAPSMQLSCWLEAKWVNLTLVQNQRAIYGDPSRRG